MQNLGRYLTQDHALCDTLFRKTQHAVSDSHWRHARQAMAAFQHALERHMLIEERILYPAFERAIGHATSPTEAMRADHLRIRAVAQRLSDAVVACDMDAFVTHAEALLLLQHQHSEREEGVLYPMIERVLVHNSADVLDAMQAYGAYDVCAAA